MSDGILTILKFALIALVYLFLLRVVWLVASELKGTPALVVGTPPTGTAKAASRRGWSLVAVEPEGLGVWDVHGEITIGRAGGCAISMPDDTFVSQVHARVFEREGDAFVEDLGSTNGTLLNGDALTDARQLRKGDTIQVGSTVLEATR